MRWRRHAAVVAMLLISAAASPASSHAQQYITDDAAVTEFRACQLQMWHGERTSWVMPVCTPVRNLELSLGFIGVWEDGLDGHFEYVLQAKTLLKRLTTDGWGAGFVAGVGRDPALATTAPPQTSYYAYVPVSVSLAGDRVVLHQNTGIIVQSAARSDRLGVTWAARTEFALRRDRLLGVAEVYGAEGRAPAPPEYQIGVRAFPRPGRVQLDLSYGGLLRTGRRAQGWTLGLALVTPPFL